MNINEIKQSSFLQKSDVGAGVLLTMTGISQKNVAKQGDPVENKWCLHFQECEKPLVMNSINSQIIAAFVGSEETDEWMGKKVVLYTDPNITFGGKLVGGIRARVPKKQAAPAAAPTPALKPTLPPADDSDDSGAEDESYPF